MSMQDAVMSLWTGRCTVQVLEHETDERTGRTTSRRQVIYKDLPCHLTYYYYLHHATQGETSQAYQRGALFVAREIEIPQGSTITVVQNGATSDYALSGIPVVYSCHREVPVARIERWV